MGFSPKAREIGGVGLDREVNAGPRGRCAGVRARGAKGRRRPLPALQFLLSEIVDFLLASGLSRAEAVRELTSQQKRILKRRGRLQAESEVHARNEGQQWIEVSGVVHDWHRSEKYTDKEGDPIPLDSEALTALMKKRFTAKQTERALSWMLENKVIRRNKDRRFELVRGRPVLLRGKAKRALALERAAAIVPQYLNLILRNAATADVNSREVERDARVLFLPEKYVPLWRSLAKERAQTFLEGMDNWLEDHASKDDAEPVREVGMHVHCYTGDLRAAK